MTIVSAAVFWVATSSPASAKIDYGTFASPNIMFIDVSEDSNTDPLPLWGPPTLAGDSLVFSPTGFGAFSDGGGADLTDGTLTMTIMGTDPRTTINFMRIRERGDYTLAGVGTAATMVEAAGTVFLTVIEIDGVSVNPVEITTEMIFNPSGGDFFLPTEPGVGVLWEGEALIDVDAELAGRNIAGSATKVLFNMNNTLLAVSEAGSVAFIKKKAAGDVLSITPIPEPSSLMLAALAMAGLVGLVLRRRVAGV